MSAQPSVVKVIETVVKEFTGKGDMFTAHQVTKEVRNRGHFLKHDDGKEAVHDLYNRGEFGIAYTRTQINVGGGWPWLYHKSADDPAKFGGVYGGGTPQVSSPAPSYPTSSTPSSSSPQDDATTIKIPSSFGHAVLPDDDEDSGDEDSGDDDGDSSLSTYTQPPQAVGSLASLPPVAAPSSMITRTTPTIGGNNGHAARVSQANQKNGRRVDARKTLSIPTPLIRDHLGLSPGDKVYLVARTDHVEVRKDYPSATGSLVSYTVDCNNQVRITQSALKKAGIGGNSYDVEEEGDKIVVKSAS